MPRAKKSTEKKSTGLGDVVAKITTAVGIEPCEGCNKRKDLLNALFPFQKAKELTPEHQEWFKGYLERASNKISREDAMKMFEIYNESFMSKAESCYTCAGLLKAIISKVKKVYDFGLNKSEQ